METYEDLYQTICRVCLAYGKKDNLVCLVDKNSEDGLSIHGKAVQTFANIFINYNDELPKFMCQNCFKILKFAIYFKLKCESSDKQLFRLFEIHRETGSNLKESIVDFLMFKTYFPQKSSTSTSIKVPQKNSDIKVPEVNNKSASDSDNSDFENDTADNNADEQLKVLEKMVGLSPTTRPIQDTKDQTRPTLIKWSTIQRKKHLIAVKRMQWLKKNKRHRPEKTPEKLICKICQKELANPLTYKHHMQRHNGCKYICEHCGKGFPVLMELNMHQVARHGTGLFLQCPHCSYKAPRKHNLIEHIRLHTGERPFACEKCGLTFRRRAIWKKHLIHHTEKTVQCPHCPKKFFRQSSMQAHANNIHERMYVYLCHKCDATYAKSITVRRHLAERHGIPREMQGKIKRVKKGEVHGIL